MTNQTPLKTPQATYRKKIKNVQFVVQPDVYNQYYKYITENNLTISEFFRTAANYYIQSHPTK